MTQKYQVKVSMKQAAVVETGIVLKQGDFGMQIEIEVLDFDVTGTTPQIVFRKAMGAVESTTITVSSNKYTYTFKGTELDTPGKVFCDLKLKNSTTQRISTASFMFKVVADTLDGLAEESSSYSDTIAQIISGIKAEMTAGIEDTNKKIIELDYRDNDKFKTLATYYINFLTDERKVEDELYNHNTINVSENSATNRFIQIAIKKNTTYYYGNIWAYFSAIKYNNGTIQALSNETTTSMSGSFTAADDGYVYITVIESQTNYIFTDSQELYNSGIWTSYAVLIASIDGSKVNNNSLSFSKINFKSKELGINLFNKLSAVNGYVNYSNGNIVSNDSYRASDYIPIDENTTYTINPVASGAQTAYYNAAKEYISGKLYSGGGSGTDRSPSGAKYMRTTTSAANLDIFAVCKGFEAEYSPYTEKEIISPAYLPTQKTKAEYDLIVARDGSGDYESLTEAVANAISGMRIFVKSGVYDGEEVEAWTKELTIIGENKLTTIIKNGLNTYSRPPLEMVSGTLKNITIYAYDGGEASLDPTGWLAYGIHVDSLANMKDKSFLIENCIIKCDKSAAIGMGMSKGCNVEIKDCILWSRDNFAFFWHDAINNDYVGTQNISCHDTNIISHTETRVMKIDSECKPGAVVNCSFYRNILASDAGTATIWTVNQTSGGATTEGTFIDLINFYKSSDSYLNNIASLNN